MRRWRTLNVLQIWLATPTPPSAESMELFCMKTWKNFGFLIIMAFVLTFVACDNGNGVTDSDTDPREPYFNSWIEVDNWKVTFFDDKLIAQDDSGDDWDYTVSPITWIAVVNTNVETKKDYPSGYKITGYVSEQNGDAWEIDQFFGEDWAYFIHKNKKSIIEQDDDNLWYNIMNLQ